MSQKTSNYKNYRNDSGAVLIHKNVKHENDVEMSSQISKNK